MKTSLSFACSVYQKLVTLSLLSCTTSLPTFTHKLIQNASSTPSNWKSSKMISVPRLTPQTQFLRLKSARKWPLCTTRTNPKNSLKFTCNIRSTSLNYGQSSKEVFNSSIATMDKSMKSLTNLTCCMHYALWLTTRLVEWPGSKLTKEIGKWGQQTGGKQLAR